MKEAFLGQKKGITSADMKIWAVVTMAIDHFAAVVLAGVINASWMGEINPVLPDGFLYNLYMIMRYIGRLSFPLFCFMIVQGFLNTRSAGKYLARLSVFALISEIPYDLAIGGGFMTFEEQNVFFTLSVGLLCIIMLDSLEKWLHEDIQNRIAGFAVAAVAVTAICCAVNELINADYGLSGILAIVLIYIFRNRAILGMAAACAALTFIAGTASVQVACFAAVVFAALYNGQKGKMGVGKYFFYAFYPAHLLVLWIVLYACIVFS